ncbi:MAG: spermine synthase [Candidatus Nitronauta litoralis]|uniref:Polyamine aminopropyltransferase n=1 Tax=Candidatus Nitronauta litoralis TaxID=2705533 RepID=A0A7T0BZB2_9BACT|nr:MAG: spermine synthase [Candidatus Nitronauta litoralis]
MFESDSLRSLRFLPGLCLFASGAASLTYELVWIRQLSLVFGGTLYAISTVLCAFMTGLALGSWLVSLWLKRSQPRNLFLLYGTLEALIGIYGLVFPWLLEATTPLYPLLVSIAGEGPGLYFLEFLWGTLLMLPSTFLMGATLPVLGTWSVGQRTDSILSNVSWLYGMNTAGAVAGCLFTQFLTIKWLGIAGANLVAVILNGLVFLLCRLFNPSNESSDPPKKPARQSQDISVTPKASWCLLGLFAFSGLVALSAEILWTRVLVIPLGSSLYSFALILAAFLFGIAFGSLVADRLFKNHSRIKTFLILEGSLGLLGLLMIPLFDQITPLTSWLDAHFYDTGNTAFKTLTLRSAVAFLLMFPPAFGFGLIFPIANQIHLSLFENVSTTMGGSYAVNTIGSILGTVLTPFVFIPLWGIERSLFILFGSLLLMTCLIVLFIPEFKKRARTVPAFAIIVIALGFWIIKPGIATDQLGKNNLSRIDHGSSSRELKLVDYLEGDFSTLSVVEDKKKKTRTLFVNGFSTATVSEQFGGTSYMQAMGFVPMMLHPKPKDALVICFGTGNTIGTVASFPEVQVDGVEIDRNVLSMAHWFSEWNGDVRNKSNVNFYIQDGRQFVQWSEKKYDVITLEPMHPAHAGVAHLYSSEFYEQARGRLNPGGIMMQWLPLHLLNSEDSLAVLKTFKQSFPHTTLWNSYLTRIVLLVGSDQPLKLDPQNFLNRMQNPDVGRAGGEIGVRSFLDFLDFYITDADYLNPILEGSSLITDNRPILEHSAVNLLPPFARETDETFLNFLLGRIGKFPNVIGLTSNNKTLLRSEFEKRTAQRLSVFSQRYQGPGTQAFQSKSYSEGLQAVSDFMEKKSGKWIGLSDAGWKEKGVGGDG